MPIYEYACKNCDHTLDALQKMDEEPLVYCPSCGEPGLRKLISAPRFRLKGEGWYETDFKKDNQRNLAKSDDVESTKSDKPESKSDKAGSTESGSDTKTGTKSKKSSDKKPGGKVDSA